jgi:hypothetical protein
MLETALADDCPPVVDGLLKNIECDEKVAILRVRVGDAPHSF